MCCGNKRAAVSGIKPAAPVTFEYRGNSSLTVVGSATRRIYWFSGRGARVTVQAGDAAPLQDDRDLAPVDPARA